MAEHFDMLRRVLEEKGVLNAAQFDLPVILWEEDVTPPKGGGAFATFLIQHNNPNRKVEAGNGRKGGMRQVDGMIEYIIYMPEKTGSGPATKMGDNLQPYFDTEQIMIPPFGEVQFEGMSVMRLPKDKRGYARVSVWGYFRYRYHAGLTETV